MFYLQLFLLPIIGFIGIMFNWLLVLAIQRKTYYYQHSQRNPIPMTNKSLLQVHSSFSGHIIQTPLLLPSVRSSISTFDKFILAFLINDIFVCNFLLPLRLVEISRGLPCGFLCFIFKFFEKITTIIELIIINLLLITSLIFFWKQRLLTTKLWFILFTFMLPILVGGFLTTLTYIDVEEYELNNRSPPCKQSFIYIDSITEKTLNIFCCIITYFMIFMNFILLIKMKSAIKAYKQKALRSLTEAAISGKNESPMSESTINDNHNRRRSMYYFPSISIEPSAPSSTPPPKRSVQSLDYLTYLTVNENSHTLIRSTGLILFIYLLLYIPYWFYELSNNQILYQLKDIFFLCHIFKPFCYMLTNEKYRHH
ncbi:unnamed protein product [Rotaria sp. Silwood1]|nr:unnamed protein product [Rotaria sp. Silwood1]CAF1088634.1 unnamed protein product [Rotaria sp. Silwood1]CAF1110978.1 unnamed protein product [Rotaria sp. Silwood1]CAF3431164.1 unnamed protein product [Rotaria sp. Silwood1]CAF3447079.1 unnamed protein product [Rotaria sp. Silwood1]